MYIVLTILDTVVGIICPLVEIGLTVWPKIAPLATGLIKLHIYMLIDFSPGCLVMFSSHGFKRNLDSPKSATTALP